MTSDRRVHADERRLRDDEHRGAPPTGVRQVSALLPNGRTAWLQVAPPLAADAELERVAHLAEHVHTERRSGIVAHAEAIRRLSLTIEADAERLSQSGLDRARAIGRRIAAEDNRLDRRLAKAREEFRARLAAQIRVDREHLRRLRRRDLWDKILLATALPLFAAYGTRGNPFSTENLTLTVTLLIWLAGDTVVDAIFGADGPKSPYALEDADVWSYLAPFGNLLAGWWLLGGRQHARFVTGVTTIALRVRKPRPPLDLRPYRFATDVDLEARIAPDHFPDFETFAGVPAVATFGRVELSDEGRAIDPDLGNLRVRVQDGALRLSFTATPRTPAPHTAPFSMGEAAVAWMLDTQEPLARTHDLRQTMARQDPLDDLVAVVSDALTGDATRLRALAADARRRADERARRDTLDRTPGQGTAASQRVRTPRPLPRPGPDTGSEIRFPDGRRARAAISPAVARRHDLDAVARASAQNHREAYEELRRQRRTITRLGRAQQALARDLHAIQDVGDHTLIGLAQGLDRVARGGDWPTSTQARGAMAAVADTSPGSPGGTGPVRRPPTSFPPGAARQLQRAADVQMLGARALMHDVTNVVHTLQAAAYGQKGSLLAANNLLLGASQLFWSLLDPVLQQVGLLNTASATAVAALAPIASLLTGQILLGDRQHVRFVSGVTDVETTSGVTRESLRGRVAEGLWPAFRQRSDVSVIATVVEPRGLGAPPVTADVTEGALRLGIVTGASIEAVVQPQRVRVAWTVDLGEDVG